MNYWLISLNIFIVALIQVSLLPNLAIEDFIPNLVAIFLVTYLLLDLDKVAIWWVALGGLLLDLFSPLPFGLFVAQFVIIYLVLRHLIRPIIHEPAPLMSLPVFFVTSLLFNGIELVIIRSINIFDLLLLAIIESLIGTIVYSFIHRRYLQNSPIKLRGRHG